MHKVVKQGLSDEKQGQQASKQAKEQEEGQAKE